MAGIQTTTKRRIKQFFLDQPKDIEAYEKILNNPKFSIVNREMIKTKESEKTTENRVVTEITKDRISYVIDYAEEVIEGQ